METIAQKPAILKCFSCKVHLYTYTGKRKGKIELDQLHPVKAEYGYPQKGQDAKCPECGESIFPSISKEHRNDMRLWKEKYTHVL